MSISILSEHPHTTVPMAHRETASWFAPLRPRTLHKRPYNGVNVHVASRYLEMKMLVVANNLTVHSYAVPSQLAWLDLLKSEDIDGSTAVVVEQLVRSICLSSNFVSSLLVGTSVTDVGNFMNNWLPPFGIGHLLLTHYHPDHKR